MTTTLYILANTKGIINEFTTDQARTGTIINYLQHAYKTAFQCCRIQKPFRDETDVIMGSDDPNIIREYASRWNADIFDELTNALTRSLETHFNTKNTIDQRLDTLSIRQLAQASIRAIHGASYHAEKLLFNMVIDENPDSTTWKFENIMTPYQREHIIQNPEQYVILCWPIENTSIGDIYGYRSSMTTNEFNNETIQTENPDNDFQNDNPETSNFMKIVDTIRVNNTLQQEFGSKCRTMVCNTFNPSGSVEFHIISPTGTHNGFASTYDKLLKDAHYIQQRIFEQEEHEQERLKTYGNIQILAEIEHLNQELRKEFGHRIDVRICSILKEDGQMEFYVDRPDIQPPTIYNTYTHLYKQARNACLKQIKNKEKSKNS